MRYLVSLCFLIIITAFQTSKADTGLMIIDMQPSFTDVLRQIRHETAAQRESNRVKLSQAIARQLVLIQMAKMRGLPIALLEFQGAGSTHPDIVAALSAYDNYRIFVKPNQNAFFGSQTEKILAFFRDFNASNLIFAGANGEACVLASIRGALRNNFSVWADSHAIISFNFEDYIYPYIYASSDFDVPGHTSIWGDRTITYPPTFGPPSNFLQFDDPLEIDKLIMASEDVRKKPQRVDIKPLSCKSAFGG